MRVATVTDRPVSRQTSRRPRRGLIYATAWLCVRYPFLTSALFGIITAGAAVAVLPIPNDQFREIAAAALGVIAYLGWSTSTETPPLDSALQDDELEAIGADAAPEKFINV